jgi:hypothetical protein
VAAVVAQHFSYGVIGFYGVSVFFVLSGYLITSLLLAEREQTGTISLRGFYRRRFARLSPALVVVVTATFVWVLTTGEPVRQWFAGFIGSLTYSTDIIELTPWQHHIGADFEWSWSLAVEEQFYLLWPALILVCGGGWLALRSLKGVQEVHTAGRPTPTACMCSSRWDACSWSRCLGLCGSRWWCRVRRQGGCTSRRSRTSMRSRSVHCWRSMPPAVNSARAPDAPSLSCRHWQLSSSCSR